MKTKFENPSVSGVSRIYPGFRLFIPGHAIGDKAVILDVPDEHKDNVKEYLAASHPAIVVTEFDEQAAAEAERLAAENEAKAKAAEAAAKEAEAKATQEKEAAAEAERLAAEKAAAEKAAAEKEAAEKVAKSKRGGK